MIISSSVFALENRTGTIRSAYGSTFSVELCVVVSLVQALYVDLAPLKHGLHYPGRFSRIPVREHPDQVGRDNLPCNAEFVPQPPALVRFSAFPTARERPMISPTLRQGGPASAPIRLPCLLSTQLRS